MKKTAFLTVLLLLAVLFVPLAAADSGTAAETVSSDGPTGDFLLDYGDGQVEWYDLNGGGTVRAAAEAALTAAAVTHDLTGTSYTVAGIAAETLGAKDTGGSFTAAGTTGTTVFCSWQFFRWDAAQSVWKTAEPGDPCDGPLALAYYPAGLLPTVTPEHRSAWTAAAGNAANTADQTTALNSAGTEDLVWSNDADSSSYSTILCADGFVFVKYGYADADGNAKLVCYDTATWTAVWTFAYPAASYETTTAVIAGQYIFVQSTYGHLYKFPWATGPGADNAAVTTFGGAAWDADVSIPGDTGAELAYMNYGDSLTSLVYSSGCLFLKAYNGMVYCFDTDLDLIWSYQTGGRAYYSPPTVCGDWVAAGMYDGHLYILSKLDGSLVVDETVHEEAYTYLKNGVKVTTTIGNANVALFTETAAGLTVYLTYDDGRGMNTMNYGVTVYRFDGKTLTAVASYDQGAVGAVGKNLCLAADGQNAYLVSSNGLYLLDPEGHCRLLSADSGGQNNTHAFPVLVNGKYLFLSTYSSHKILMLDTDGTTVAVSTVPISSYSMAAVTVCDGLIIGGNDAGAYAFTALAAYTAPVYTQETPLWELLVLAAVVILAALAVFWAVLRFGLKWEQPFAQLRRRVHHFFYGTDCPHNTRSRRRLWAVLACGIALTLLVALLSLCLGPKTDLSVGEALGALVSSLQKGGQNLTYNEMLIYNSRLPRTVAALCVGIGLSVAGAVYQAVIKNPLVEPYIMGVSSGAGTLAIAVIVFDFTFFGLFPADSPYLTVLAAIVGGLLAFGLTMLLAVKTGGRSVNYVLAGIIIGLVFGAVQSLMMVMAGNDISSALSWLYGSFASMTWEKVGVMLFPVLFLSLVPLLWAKELNLVLLGEDQARQMGLNARRFDNLMLILASVLTAFCVAFCGVIGFVGLVIPHLCRMILGGDHRLMLPACMAFGGFLMITADLLARILLTGYELPVGAITTIIGVPVFAYLLIKRGKSYET